MRINGLLFSFVVGVCVRGRLTAETKLQLAHPTGRRSSGCLQRLSQTSQTLSALKTRQFGKQKPEQLLQLTIARAFDLIEECAGEPRAS
jgi:hypothetical protein